MSRRRRRRCHRYVRNFEEIHTGLGVVDLHTVTVETDHGAHVFPRSELTAILAGDDLEASRWTGFDVNGGASEQSYLSVNASVTRPHDDQLQLRIGLGWDI